MMTPTNNKPHPCHGYDVACGDVCIKLETMRYDFDDAILMLQGQKTTTSNVDDIKFNELYARVRQIAIKYDKTTEETIQRIITMHEDWVED